jgi:hypothetical protein
LYANSTFQSFYLTDYKSIGELVEAALGAIVKTKVKKFYAHYGGKFDFLLIMKEMLKIKGATDLAPAINDNSIYTLKFKYNKKSIVFADSHPLLSASLDSLFKAYALSISKGLFPHKFMSPATLDYIGKKPAKEY